MAPVIIAQTQTAEGGVPAGGMPATDTEAERNPAVSQSNYAFKVRIESGWSRRDIADGKIRFEAVSPGIWKLNIAGTQTNRDDTKLNINETMLIQIEKDGRVFRLKKTGQDAAGKAIYEKEGPALGTVRYMMPGDEWKEVTDFDYSAVTLDQFIRKIDGKNCVMRGDSRPLDFALIQAVPAARQCLARHSKPGVIANDIPLPYVKLEKILPAAIPVQ